FLRLHASSISSPFPYTTLFRSDPLRPVALRLDLAQRLLENRPFDSLELEIEADRRVAEAAFRERGCPSRGEAPVVEDAQSAQRADRKSTRLNSSHLGISYAVFC